VASSAKTIEALWTLDGGLKLAIKPAGCGNESGTYVKLTQSGADLFA
jgi:hypothetical protein